MKNDHLDIFDLYILHKMIEQDNDADSDSNVIGYIILAFIIISLIAYCIMR